MTACSVSDLAADVRDALDEIQHYAVVLDSDGRSAAASNLHRVHAQITFSMEEMQTRQP